MRKVYYIKQTPSGRVFDAVNGIVIALLMFLMIYPFWNMLILSFNDGTDALLGKLYFWPRVWTLSNYEYVFGICCMARWFPCCAWSWAR